MKLNVKLLLRTVEFLALLALLGFLFYWRFQVSETRFFDVDEFTHMHWAADMARGQKPYVDFFTFFTPGFYWMLMPLFWLYSRNPMIFLAARMSMLFVFAGTVCLIGILFALLRSRRYALLPMVLLAFLPMPYDKFLEIRPDNVATFLGLAGVVVQVYAMLNRGKKDIHRWWLTAGISYALSLVVLVKTLPFVVMGVIIASVDAGFWEWVSDCFRRKRIIHYNLALPYKMFILGLAGVLGIFVLWLLSLGHLSTVWYSLTKMAFEANTVGQLYSMEPNLFFFPNVSFYGDWGITRPLIINHTIWIVGVIAGTYRLVTPFLTADGKRERVLSELLVSSIFILSVIGYVMFFPLKHSQYLIPIAIFIVWFAADFCIEVLRFCRKNLFGDISVVILILLFSYVLAKETVHVNALKLITSNTVQLTQTNQLLTMIGPNGTVLDLDGRLIFWKDPYYICCLPFGTFEQYLSHKPPSLSDALESERIQYIFQGDSGRLGQLWSDLPYIESHYTRVPGWGDALWKRNDL